MFRHVEVVAPFGENSWLLGCPHDRVAALIDPGGHIDDLLAVASDRRLDIEQIWLTHAHIDHVAGVAEAVAATGATLALHPLDRPLYDAVEEQASMFGLHVPPLPQPDRWLAADDVMGLGRLRARVLHVPGHAPGHVAFWFDELDLVFSGDCLFAGSIGRTDLPGGNYETLMSSIRCVLLPLGDEVRCSRAMVRRPPSDRSAAPTRFSLPRSVADVAPGIQPVAWSRTPAQAPISRLVSHFSALSAARQPYPAAVTACR